LTLLAIGSQVSAHRRQSRDWSTLQLLGWFASSTLSATFGEADRSILFTVPACKYGGSIVLFSSGIQYFLAHEGR